MSQLTPPLYSVAMLSDVGRMRRGNEDRCAAEPARGLYIVCDGMGGAAAGEVASALAMEGFLAFLRAAPGEDPEQELQAAVDAANTRVHEHSKRAGLRGMGTTLVALWALPEGSLWLTHVGDSRCYRLRGGRLEAMTRDHSLVQEQIQAGQITAEQAERSPIRNVITRAIGSAPEVRAEIQRLSPEPGDLYLLASDGLTREVPDAELAALLASTGAAEGNLEVACAVLVEAANAAGGRDNVTVLLVSIKL